MHDLTEGHICKRYDGELSHLHHLLLEMGGVVVDQLRNSLACFKSRDFKLAEEVIGGDVDVDRLEMKIDEETIKVIARRCPVGVDLRVIMAVSKCVSDLEGIGDEAAKIAGLVPRLFGNTTTIHNNKFKHLEHDVDRLGQLALESVRTAVVLFDMWDEKKALEVVANYRQMDREFNSELHKVMTYVMEDYRNISFAVGMVLLTKSLDSIAHNARNIAYHAIYEMKGVDIR